MLNSRRFVVVTSILAVLLTAATRAQQQPRTINPQKIDTSVPVGSTLGTVGSGIAGEGSTPGSRSAPTGPAPRLANGRPDLNGVWDHAYVPDMSLSAKNLAQQKAPGPLPLTPAGMQNIASYDPERDGDYTGMCMPYGLTRSFNGPFPIQIMQTDKHLGFLFEMGTWFHVAPFKDAHSAEPNPAWFGESIAKWDGDTLVLDTVGFNGWSRLDTRGHPHSDKLHVVQTFRRYDAGHMAYTVTVDDPVYYSKPWTNERTFTMTSGALFEYSCEENNRSLWEGRIKLWTIPGTEPLRNPVLGKP
jgi:hypothetical protein